MDREQLLELWSDMWKEGNWVPSWPDTLDGLTVDDAVWRPNDETNCVWQEVVHVIFWRNVTINKWSGGKAPTGEEVERLEFAMPGEVSEESWSAALQELKRTQDVIAAAIQDETKNLTRVTYHLIHDAYHLGRVTQLRKMQGTAPKF